MQNVATKIADSIGLHQSKRPLYSNEGQSNLIIAASQLDLQNFHQTIQQPQNESGNRHFAEVQMKRFNLHLLSVCIAFIYGISAQAQSPTTLTLSKDLGGNITRESLRFTMRANPTCDQAGEAFPDGTLLVATGLNFVGENNRLGLLSGSVQLQTADGKVLQAMTLRGTYGLNTRRNADKNCRYDHLEAMLEPVPTFAPVKAPQIALAHLAADLIPEAAGVMPLYRATLDGIVTTPATMENTLSVAAEKSTYEEGEFITAIITNNSPQAVLVYDLRSFCSIVSVQKQDGDEWKNVGQCFLKRRSFAVKIEPGTVLRINLPADKNAKGAFSPGNYRLVLDYFPENDPSTGQRGESQQTMSPTFTFK